MKGGIRFTTVMLAVLGATSWPVTVCRADFLTGLEVYYQFDGNGADSSGNARDVGLFGGVGFSSGLYGQALSLDGDVNKFAQRPIDDSVLNFGANDFTIQVWVNFNTITNAEQTLIEKFDDFDGPGWTISKVTRSSGSNIEYFDNGAFGPVDTIGLSITTGEWHHLIARRSGNTLDLLFDGFIERSDFSTGAITSTTMPLLIGRRNDDDPGGFATDGRLDEIAIWTRALTDVEIEGLYNDGAGMVLTPIPEPSSLALLATGAIGLIGYGWRRKRKQAA